MNVQARTIPVCNHFADCFAVIRNKVSAMFDAYERALYAHHTFEPMFAMSDQELAQAGLSRDDLPRIITRKMGWC